jgi:hypothetical protein
MLRVWTPLFLLGLTVAIMGTAAWGEQSRPVPQEKHQEEDAIPQDLEMVRELEMLQMLQMLQEIEMLGEMAPLLPPEPASEEEAR